MLSPLNKDFSSATTVPT